MGAIENEMNFARLIPGSILIKMIEATVNAGFPSPAQDYSEEEVNLIKEFGLDRPSVFVMRITGNSIVWRRQIFTYLQVPRLQWIGLPKPNPEIL
jgi:hypothetical protein